MATEEVLGDEIRSVDKIALSKEDIEAQTSSEDTNTVANKQGQEFARENVGHDDDDEVDEATKSLYYQLPIEDEAQRLLKEIGIAIKQVKESKFYAKLTEQIKGDAIQGQLKRVLGSHQSQLEMVIYALGSLEFSFNPHYQLAIALLLKQDFSSWIERIQVYDPVFSPVDVIVLKELGCEVLLVNERCRRKVEKPTLFYMPYSDFHLVGDLLEANWCPSRINQLILLESSITSTYGRRPKGKNSKTKFCGNSEDYIYAIQSHTKEILIESNYGNIYDNIFYNFAFHFFKVDSQLDMDILIRDEDGELSKMRLQCQRKQDMFEPADFFWEHKCIEEFFMEPFAEDAPKEDWAYRNGAYRGPRRFRCSWNPPPRGWMKLNFGGRSSNNLAGFGGICHNESKQPILIYTGALCKVDQTMACVEALMFGLGELLKVPNLTRNLIVEGDDIRVIQWANKRQHEVPGGLHESLNRVLDLLKEFHTVIYHIYEEANLVANNLAKKGALSGNHVYLAGQNAEDLEDVDNLVKSLHLVD